MILSNQTESNQVETSAPNAHPDPHPHPQRDPGRRERRWHDPLSDRRGPRTAAAGGGKALTLP